MIDQQDIDISKNKMHENLKISARSLRSLVIVIKIYSRMFKAILGGLQTQEHYCTPTKYNVHV